MNEELKSNMIAEDWRIYNEMMDEYYTSNPPEIPPEELMVDEVSQEEYRKLLKDLNNEKLG